MKVPQSSAKCHPKAVNWQMLEVIQTSSMLTDSLAISHEAHNGMLRESGDKYITHPFGVAEMYYALNPSDEIGTSASLLHDVVEMSSITLPEIERFLGSIGTQISFIVFIYKINPFFM